MKKFLICFFCISVFSGALVMAMGLPPLPPIPQAADAGVQQPPAPDATVQQLPAAPVPDATQQVAVPAPLQDVPIPPESLQPPPEAVMMPEDTAVPPASPVIDDLFKKATGLIEVMLPASLQIDQLRDKANEILFTVNTMLDSALPESSRKIGVLEETFMPQEIKPK